MAITYLKKDLPIRTSQRSDQEAPKPGEKTAQSLTNQDHSYSSPASEVNRGDEHKINPGHSAMHSMPDCIIDGGIATTGFKPRERAKQHDRTPLVGGPESHSEGVGTDRNIQNGAENKAPIRLGHDNIRPGARFVNRDMSREEFLEYFREGNA